MKLWVEGPTPYVKEREPYYDIFRKNLEMAAREGTETELHFHKAGYKDPIYTWTASYNAIEGVKSAYAAWKKGYDAYVLTCITDPGLREARSIVDIPVVGILESAALIACCLGTKFSILPLHAPSVPRIAAQVKNYGLADRLASVRCARLSATEAAALYAEPEKLMGMFRELAVKAIGEDGAEVIIPGCGIVSSMFTSQKVFEIENVPLVDGVTAAIKMAEVLVDLKKTYGIGVCRTSIYAAAPNWEREIPINYQY